MSEVAGVDLVLLWHHHQPEYRSPRTGVSRLPWVRLHAAKDYLDMARHLERHPGIKAAFNFVPALLDQLEAAAGGAADELFEMIARPVDSLSAAERGEVTRRCGLAPRHALDRWPAYAALVRRGERSRAPAHGPTLGERELLALETWFLLAWLDPTLHGEPEAARALAAGGEFTARHRDDLLALHRRVLADVIPAYRTLAERGQVELSASAYDHPILPLLVGHEAARRARPDLKLPAEPFAAPEDAARQIERALERHARAFGSRPNGMWPPEGGVSPEVAEIAARAGVRWLATDEDVLWKSLPPELKRRESLYRPWRFETAAGSVALLFRDLARYLGSHNPFFGLQSRGLDGAQGYLNTIEEMAAHYLLEIRELQPEGPYYLGGFCMGGTVAYEMAQRLHAQSQEVRLLALFDTYNHNGTTPQMSFRNRVRNLMQMTEFHWTNIMQLSPQKRVAYLAEKLTGARERELARLSTRLANIWRRLKNGAGNGSDRVFLEELNEDAGYAYRPQVYPGKVTLFRPRRSYSFFPDRQMGWAGFAVGTLEVVELPVDPGGMFLDPFVRDLAEKLSNCLDAAQR